MENTPTIEWPGQSDTKYKYWIYPIGSSFINKPGGYVFAKEVRPGHWAPIYVGQTDDLGRRLASHEKEEKAKRQGATHIHAHTNVDGEQARLREEYDIIARWKPVCNEQLV